MKHLKKRDVLSPVQHKKQQEKLLQLRACRELPPTVFSTFDPWKCSRVPRERRMGVAADCV